MKSNDTTIHTSLIKAKTLANIFAEQEGRRPRVLLSKLDQEYHEYETKIIASAYADIGFDVDLGPSFQSAKDISKQAMENDVHVLHVSSLDADSIHIIPEIIESFSSYGCDDILLIVDGKNLTEVDIQTLTNYGVQLIFESDANISEVAIQILDLLIA